MSDATVPPSERRPGDRAALSRAFLESDPGAAAQVVEELPTADAAAFLVTCPPEIVAPLMVELRDVTAARLLAGLTREAALPVLREMPANEAAFLLRLTDEKRREALLDGLPKRLASRVRRYLSYPGDRLGAWTEADTLTLDADQTVADALERARSGATPPDDPLFLVGEGRNYRGAVALRDLLRAGPGRRLGGLALRDLPPLLDRATVASVGDLAVWAVHNRVPVVDRSNRFVGVLTERSVRSALARPEDADRAAAPEGGALLHVGAGYVGALATALHLILARRP